MQERMGMLDVPVLLFDVFFLETSIKDGNKRI